jgi:glycyl-tRNA synthetase beta chain
LASKTSNTVADAVLGGTASVAGKSHPVVHFPAYAMAKALALKAVVDQGAPWLAKAKLVTKRLAGISKETAPLLAQQAKFTGAVATKASSDATIVRLVQSMDAGTGSLTSEGAVRDALAATETVATQLDEIFTAILVNDPADGDTPVRLGVLSHGAQCMLRIADFTKLS